MPAWLVQPNMLFLIVKQRLLSSCRFFHSWAPEIEKSESCWRAPTEDKGFAGRSTPTMTLADLKNPEHVGVSRRRYKGLRACPRQHLRRIPANEIRLLACPDRDTRVCGHAHANTLMSIIKKRMFTLYKRQSPRKK